MGFYTTEGTCQGRAGAQACRPWPMVFHGLNPGHCTDPHVATMSKGRLGTLSWSLTKDAKSNVVWAGQGAEECVSGAVITDLITGKIHLKQKEVTGPCGWVH